MVEVMSGVPEDEEEQVDDGDDEEPTDTEMDVPGSTISSRRWDIDEDRMHLDAARIYEHTIVQLGERLGDPLGARNMSAD